MASIASNISIESNRRELVFACDDSEIVIESSPHTIMAAILTDDLQAMEQALIQLKSQFGMSLSEEVKWNGMNLVQRDREALSQELLSLLHKATTFVMISEGVDRQIAAERATRQLADYLASNPYRLEGSPSLSLIFDEGIIGVPSKYGNFLRTNFSPPVSNATFTSVESHASAVIQLADVTAGFNRLVTDISLGRPNREIEVLDDGLDVPIKMDLRSYICISQRWNIWGQVPPPPDPENVTFDGRWPFKHVGGYGVRIVSSIPTDVVREIYDSRIVYMGCMH
jgi:uncharacterized protein DUF3800